MRSLPLVVLTLCLVAGPSRGDGSDKAYRVIDIPVPEDVVVEAGGVCHWPDGTLVVATRRGDVWTVRDGNWNRFATGLMGPMGIWSDKIGEVHVTQWPELTRILDLDGDLRADRYETVSAGWEMPGARTDFVYGLCRDPQGNFYRSMHTTHKPWKSGRQGGRGNSSKFNFGGPMGAPVKGRGWSFQVDPEGRLTWWSSGLRAPNGLAFNAEGDLFATDNQGDWVGTSALHHIERGDFHGHPSSYQWDPARTVELDGPLDQLADKLDKIRKRPAVLFPHGILGNSPSEPVLAPWDGSFGPFAGQFLVGDNVAPLISRVYLERIDGQYQGVCFPFLRGNGLQKALCRMDFSPRGELVVEFGCRGWGPATTGLQKVVWTGEKPFEMKRINLWAGGFKITFTKPLAEQDFSGAVKLLSYHYKYHHLYGSPQVDKKPLAVAKVTPSSDRRALWLEVPGLEAGKICEFQLAGIVARDGSELANRQAFYTLNRLKEKDSSATAWPFFPLCMDTHDAAKRSLAEQAALFRELGYAGCGHLCQSLGYGNISHPPNTTVEERAETLAHEGLRLLQAYGRVRLEDERPIDLDRLEEMMPTLAAHRSQLVLLLLGDREADLDNRAVELLGAIADLAKPHGVKIALYPHRGDYVQTIGEALRVVRKLDRRDEVGVMFTFNHWKSCDPNRDLRAVLADAGPWLKSVSINGTTGSGASILPLDQGNDEAEQVLDVLRDIGFSGPVGLMCWSIRGDAREHLAASMRKWTELTSTARLALDGTTCEFETGSLKGKIGGERFIGVHDLIHKPTGTAVSGGDRANRHGLLSLYRVFTRDHRYGPAAYDWRDRTISVADGSVVMHWPATDDRPFELRARYSFPGPDRVRLDVTVGAHRQLVDFEVQIGSYFDRAFPKAAVWTAKGAPGSAPGELGKWHAFPRDGRAVEIIGDGRWNHGPSPVEFVVRERFLSPVSTRRHDGGGLVAVLDAKPEECFAVYTAHDGEAHFSNYNALFGRTIAAGDSATAGVTLVLGAFSEEDVAENFVGGQ